MKTLVSLALLVTLASCATSKKSVEADVAEQARSSQVNDVKALGSTIHDLINNSDTFTPAQKKELNDVLSKNKATAEKLQQESFQYRSVLIKELLSGKPDEKRVKVIKADVKRIEDLRLKNTFDTVEKISGIVSNHPDKQQFIDHLMQDEQPMGKPNR